MIRSVPRAMVRRAVSQKGFRKAEHPVGRDHEMFFLYVEDKKTAFYVKLSHGANQLRQDELKNNARILGVSGDDLYRIVCCDYDAQETLRVYGGSRNVG